LSYPKKLVFNICSSILKLNPKSRPNYLSSIKLLHIF